MCCAGAALLYGDKLGRQKELLLASGLYGAPRCVSSRVDRSARRQCPKHRAAPQNRASAIARAGLEPVRRTSQQSALRTCCDAPQKALVAPGPCSSPRLPLPGNGVITPLRCHSARSAGVGSLVVALAPGLPIVLAGRLLYGVGVGFAMHAAPAYIAGERGGAPCAHAGTRAWHAVLARWARCAGPPG